MDKALLEYEMKKAHITADELCRRMNISRSAFYRKCNGISDFTLTEINQIVDILGLETPMDIFFAN